MQTFQTSLLVAMAATAVLAAPGAMGPTTLATSTSSTVIATPVPEHAPHTADHAPTFNPGVVDDAASVKQQCFKFTSDNKDWHYANTGVWGSKTGTFGSLNGGKLCVPTDGSAGGAMYIGSTANPSAGNTKLECFFPSSGQGNCDVSLVDGYSLSVSCKVGGKTTGGSKNLWKTGKKCADTSLKSQGICKNDKGYAPKQSDVTGFFQEGINDGNNYCIWVNCDQDYYMNMNGQDVECHVSGGE